MTGALGITLLWLLSRLRGVPRPSPWPAPKPSPEPSPVPPPAADVPALPPVPIPVLGTYRVQAGDTGQRIALKFTGDVARWTDLRAANPTLMRTRAKDVAKFGFPIYAGDLINLPAAWAGLAPTPTAASAISTAAIQTAARTPTARTMATAAKAAQQTAVVTTATSKQVTKAAKAPIPWPQAKPKGLPPFPSGWELDTPVRSEVSTRAWQLLPVLWKRGKGATSVETLRGRWLTFQAQDHGGGKKGVTVYRVRGTNVPA